MMNPRLKGRIQLLSLGLRFRWAYVGGVMGIAYGIVSLATSSPGGVWNLLAAAAPVALGIGVFIHDTVYLRG